MIGLILIAASWGLLRLEKKSLVELGFDRPLARARELAIGLVLAGAFCAAQQLLAARTAGFRWVVNPDMTLAGALESLRWNTNSVLFEELIFRGYLLYQAIRLLGPRRGCWLSAAAFGVYHWFSFEVFWFLVPMLFVFLMTGLFGLMLARAFAHTGSLALPIGLHLGWNLVNIGVFSNGPIGNQLLLREPPGDYQLTGMESIWISFAVPLALPILVLLGLWWRARRSRPEPQSSASSPSSM